jgi:hypothetical protein
VKNPAAGRACKQDLRRNPAKTGPPGIRTG